MTIQKVSNQEVVISGTWNSASAYNGVIIDIRDLSSNINSDLLDLRLNGITQANITKGGMINTTSSVSALGTIYANTISATTYLNAAGGTPGGSNTQVQFNNNGSFSGNPRFTYVYDPANQIQYLYLSSCFPDAPFGGPNDLYSTVSANRFTGRIFNSPSYNASIDFNSGGVNITPDSGNPTVAVFGELNNIGYLLATDSVTTQSINNSYYNANNIDLNGNLGAHAIVITPDPSQGTGRVKVEGVFEADTYYNLPAVSVALSSLTDVSSPLNPSNGKVLTWSGTKWIASSVGASPGGSNTQVQFNNNGSFSGVSNFTYDNTTTTLGATNVSATNYYNIGPSVSAYMAATPYGTLYAMTRGLVYP